jgi:hypothetical protein
MAVLLLPLFFINVKSSHDWGGDFAMYIMQAKNIWHGQPQGETAYIYNPENPVLGPPAYPAGFPMLLSPVYAIAGNSIYAFSLWITAFLYGTGMLMMFAVRKYANGLAAAFLVLIVMYNPWTLGMKLEVMSEFPFTFLLLLCFYLFERYAKGPFWAGIIIALLGGLLMSVRVIGAVFPLAVLVWAIRKRFIEKDKTPVNKCVCGFLVAVGSVLFYLLINNIMFGIPQAEGGSYTGIWGDESLYATVLYNLAYYVEQFKYFFSPWGGSWNFLPLILKAVVFTFTILGLIKAFFRRWELKEMIVLIYLGVLMVYPYRHAGIRFLFPIMPFLMIYLLEGLRTVSIFPKISNPTKTWFLGSLVLASYLNMIWFYVITGDQLIKGPQEDASEQAFEYIRKSTPVNAVIIFSKPRVLGLYTDRYSLANKKDDTADNIDLLIKDFQVDYILIHQEVSDDAIRNYVAENRKCLDEAYSNNKFEMYKINPDK